MTDEPVIRRNGISLLAAAREAAGEAKLRFLAAIDAGGAAGFDESNAAEIARLEKEREDWNRKAALAEQAKVEFDDAMKAAARRERGKEAEGLANRHYQACARLDAALAAVAHAARAELSLRKELAPYNSKAAWSRLDFAITHALQYGGVMLDDRFDKRQPVTVAAVSLDMAASIAQKIGVAIEVVKEPLKIEDKRKRK